MTAIARRKTMVALGAKVAGVIVAGPKSAP
jgi:hypothetical protein